MNLKTQYWQTFFLNELYEIQLGNKFDKDKMNNVFPNIIFVSRLSYNNGVDGKVNQIDGVIPYSEGLLTVALGGSYLGSCFVQEKPFYTAQNVAVMKPRFNEMSKAFNMFVSSLVRYESKTKYYAFGRELNSHINTDFTIKIPVKLNDDCIPIIDDSHKFSRNGYIPDWGFIENYIKSLNFKPIKTQNKSSSNTLNVSLWKEFRTERLFPVLEPGKANQQMLESGEDCFYVGAKKDDNGVMLHCQYDNSLITKGNCIVFICNGQGSVGYANYMNVDFIGTTDIVVGYNNYLNQYNGIFLATIYSKERPKYSFGRKWKTHLKDTMIMLPIKRASDQTPIIDETKQFSDEGYVPDWQFMEDYIKSLPYGDRI